MRNSISLVVLIFIYQVSFSQVKFSKTLSGYESHLSGVNVTKDGGYLACGFIRTTSATNEDFTLIRTDRKGQTMWTKTFGDTLGNRATAVLQDSDKNFVIVGTTGEIHPVSKVYISTDVTIVKLDSNGTLLWTKSFKSGVTGSVPNKIIEHSRGNYIICGTANGQRNGLVFSMTKQGNLLWTKSFNRSGYLNVWDIEECKNGDIIIVGNDYNLFFCKLDSNGNVLFNKSFSSSSQILGSSIEILEDGSYIIVGSLRKTINWYDTYCLFLYKADINGNNIWTKTYYIEEDTYGFDVKVTNKKEFVVTGIHRDGGSVTPQGPLLLRTDSLGTILFSRRLNANNVFESKLVLGSDLSGVMTGSFTLQLPDYSFVDRGFFSMISVETGSCSGNSVTFTEVSPGTLNPVSGFNIVSSGTIKDTTFSETNFTFTLNTSCSSCSKPVSAFSGTSNAYSLQLTNSSKGSENVSWDFGDGTSSNQFEPTHTYFSPGNYQVCMTNYNNCDLSSICRNFNITGTVSSLNDQFLKNNISLFPNPVSKIMYYDINISNFEIRILNNNGLEVYREKKDDGNNKGAIDLSLFIPGIYYVHIISDNGFYYDKINVLR